MIDRIIWRPNILPKELESPFQRGEHQRTLRITLHCASLCDLTEEEELALTTIRNLGNLPELDVKEIQDGFYSYSTIDDKKQAFRLNPGPIEKIQLSPFDPDKDSIAIYSGNTNHFSETYMDSGLILEFMAYFDVNNMKDPEFQSLCAELIAARANYELIRDIFVTKSPKILIHRNVPFIKELNPQTPLEAARIVGLFLRSRDLYVYETISPDGRASVTRGTFYWTSVDLKMPHIWYYQNTCKVAGILRSQNIKPEDDTAMIAHSAISRCIRVLQARDSIAFNFYVPSGDEVRSDMLYHFYYLALLLSGILDVQAIIAYRAYKVTGYKEIYASFIKSQFIDKLKIHGAIELSKLFDKGSDASHLIRLLHEIRNTIHRAEFPIVDFSDTQIREVLTSGAFVKVFLPDENKRIILEAVNRIESMERWGLIQKSDVLLFEPYTFSSILIEECFNLIDKIAELTDLNDLFPNGQIIPKLPIAPPRDDQWKSTRKIIAILG